MARHTTRPMRGTTTQGGPRTTDRRVSWGRLRLRTASSLLVVLGSLGGICLVTGDAVAAPSAALVSLDDSSPDLEQAANGWTADVGLTNLVQEPIALSVASSGTAAEQCRPTVDSATIPTAEHATVTVAIPDTCDVADGFSFTLTATAGSGGDAQTLTVRAARPSATTVDWHQLRVFSVGLPVLVFLALVASVAVIGAVGRSHPSKSLLGDLPYLDASWSFSDSWLSNVTAGAGLLTGVIGSSGVADSLLGSDSEAKLRLATVGAAVALALIASAPLALGILSSAEGATTILGLFLAAAVSVTAAGGELWVVGQTARRIGVPWLDAHAVTVASGLIVLVGVYAAVSLTGIVRSGLKPPDPPPDSDTIKAARLIAATLEAARSHVAERAVRDPTDVPVHAAITQATTYAEQIVQTEVTRARPPRRRRSALL